MKGLRRNEAAMDTAAGIQNKINDSFPKYSIAVPLMTDHKCSI